MKVTRAGSKLSVRAETSIGYYIELLHDCGTDGNAEAWMRHINAFCQQEETNVRLRLEGKDVEILLLKQQVKNLKGLVTRYKRKLKLAHSTFVAGADGKFMHNPRYKPKVFDT